MEPCARDDPRCTGFPCWGQHQPKVRNNQYATWEICQRCGIRVSYKPKRGYAGENRHMGPAPHTIKHVMEEIEKSMPPEQCNEKIVNGRLMEAQGKMLQAGLTNTMAINMSYKDYKDRMGTMDPKPKTTKVTSPKLTEEIKEEATKELVERLQQSAQGSASEEAVKLVMEAAESLASTKGRVKAKAKPKEKPLKNSEDLSMADWEQMGEAQSVVSSGAED